ncbi:glycerol-3-phosphate dehydrogenase/oxidase [Planctomycetota bacterium]|nr:glycerol-3-phosphate dehydrogenase/oxidase [Planctomycetota bacterium]
MNRDTMLEQFAAQGDHTWDIIIVGGGATGLGCAVDAAARGYKPLLIERQDFAYGTSSRSTKLVHGGVRYLQQGNLTLVLEALKERGLLCQNAPHLVHPLPFVVPNYDWWEAPFYGIGMKIYDLMAGKLGIGKSKHLSKDHTLERIPTLEQDGLRGGTIYYDGQFDDSRLAINLAQTAIEHGAVIINYMEAKSLIKEGELVKGITAEDKETGKTYELKAKAVINATGPFADQLRLNDDSSASPMIKASQGIHIVLDKEFLPGDTAIMVPKTSDGRVIFLIPWHDKVLVGTTDTPLDDIPIEPIALEEEIDFLIKTSSQYLTKDPKETDILSVFAGIRPLVTHAGDDKNTAAISRDHTINISRSGLVTVTGGKWTTYRKMAQDTIDQTIMIADLEHKDCNTHNLPIHGYSQELIERSSLAMYGSDASYIKSIENEDPESANYIDERLPISHSQLVWAVQEEMTRTIEDFLSRRTRALLLDARASIDMAPHVANYMRQTLNKDEAWAEQQINNYIKLATNYLPKN